MPWFRACRSPRIATCRGLEHVVAPVGDVKETKEKREDPPAVLVDLTGLNLVGLFNGPHQLRRHQGPVVLPRREAALLLHEKDTSAEC